MNKKEYNIDIIQKDLLSIAYFFEKMLADVMNGIFNVATRIWGGMKCFPLLFATMK